MTSVNWLPLDEAIVWAERRGASEEPLAQLTAAVAVADELRDVSEQLVGHFVARARNADCSWTGIGAAFGVSRQAAHERFAATASPSPPWPERFAADAQAAMAAAGDEMRRFRHSYLGTEHVLLGLLRHGESVAAVALDRLGVREQSVRDAIAEIVGYGETPSGACHGIGPRVKRSLEGARREARQTKHHSPRSEHLLLAIATSGGVATKILRRHDVDETRLRDQIAALLPEAPEIAAAIRHGSRRGRRLRRP